MTFSACARRSVFPVLPTLTGTPIATFNFNGKYGPPKHPEGWYGVSHTGLYLGQSDKGMEILEQFKHQPAQVRTIPWTNSPEGGNRLLYDSALRIRLQVSFSRVS